jgi:hypothetical protein
MIVLLLCPSRICCQPTLSAAADGDDAQVRPIVTPKGADREFVRISEGEGLFIALLLPHTGQTMWNSVQTFGCLKLEVLGLVWFVVDIARVGIAC